MLAWTLALVLGACRTPVGVQETGFEDVFHSLSRNVLDDGQPSAASQQILALLSQQESFRSDPEAAIARVEDFALAEKNRDLFVVLAELDYARGLQTGERQSFLEAALCAWLYLFSGELQPAPDPYAPGFRVACDIYNRGLARTLRQESGEMGLESQVVPTRKGDCAIVASRPGFPFGPEAFSRFLPSDAFRVRGLRERVRTAGLGVPLIAIRNRGQAPDATEKHMARSVNLPATALLRFEGGLGDLASGHMRASLELYASSDVSTVAIAGHDVPLESDFTTPLAYSLEGAKIWGFSLTGFLSGRTQDYKPGVYMLEPYQPGKIPIVLVHGTVSNPAVWSELINGLNLDPQVRAHFQFWLAIYNTGNPVLFSAAEIRESLVDLVQTVDPGHEDAANARAVVVGHSQGGLIARLLVSGSGDGLWRTISTTPFEEYPLDPEDRKLVRQCLFFEPLPFVRRAVFIATPHRGSSFAGGIVSALARALVSLPKELLSLNGPGRTLPPELREGMPTSVENMDPDSRFIRILGGLEFAPGVPLHSIIAVDGSGPLEEQSDGFVEYRSAHLDQAESEFIVRCGHSCQTEPATVLELRRILLEHLKSAP